MVEDDGRPGLGNPHPVLPVILQGPALCLVVLKVFAALVVDVVVTGYLHGSTEHIRPGIGHAVIGTRDPYILYTHGVRAHKRKAHRIGHIVQLVAFLLHGEVAGVSDGRVLDGHVLVLPVVDEAPAVLDGEHGIISIGAQDTHDHVHVVPVVAHERAAVRLAAVVRNHYLVVELLLGGEDALVRVSLASPWQHQLDVGFRPGRRHASVLPVLGVHVGREGGVEVAELVKVEAGGSVVVVRERQ